MIGALIFVTSFVLFTLISLGVDLTKGIRLSNQWHRKWCSLRCYHLVSIQLGENGEGKKKEANN